MDTPARIDAGSGLSQELPLRDQRATAIQRELLVDELDKTVAPKCPFCSDVMIRAVGTAFVSREEEELEGKLWRL